MYTPESQPLPTVALPTMYDLPSENPEDSGLPDLFHISQPRLLDHTCFPPNYPWNQMFSATDFNIYYDLRHLNWYKRPDWFLAIGVPRFYQGKDARSSYVIWQEKVSPLVIVELLSEGTEDEDLGETISAPNQPPTKWEVYEQILKVPYYFVFNARTDQLRFFRLVRNRYSEQILSNPRVWIPELKLGLGLWVGDNFGWDRSWLRWYDADDNWIPTPEERERQQKEIERQQKEVALAQAETERLQKEVALIQAETERQEKEAALAQAETERQQKEAALTQQEAILAQNALLIERLREMGIDPDRFLG
jgi:Uma2 family endonuclease